jgi:hypothetical protein
MNPETDPLYDVEQYLKSFGGLWQTIPDGLGESVKALRANEQGHGGTTEAIKQTRLQCYERTIREFAKLCQRINDK